MANEHHLGKYYYEFRALFTLQKLFPQEYCAFVHGDKPDLYDNGRNIGIEVARGADVQWEKLSSFFQKHIAGRKLGEIPKEKLEWFTTNGCEIITESDLGIKPTTTIIGYLPEARWLNTGNLERVIKQKVAYIDRTNWAVDQLGLYIFSDFFKIYERKDVEHLISFMQNQQQQMSKQYHLLYVDDCGWFYRCDLLSGEIDFFNTDEILHDICVRAKACAETSD